MHLASFSFSTLASVRGCPENDTVFLLMDEILLDGFVSQGEPILVTQPADLVAEVEVGLQQHFSLQYCRTWFLSCRCL